MAGRQSYFAEKRHQNNDPNFFNRIPLDEIRRNVKRIIRDIRNDNILEEDIMYFMNTQIIQACIIEAEVNMKTARIIESSLLFYINNYLAVQYPSSEIMSYRVDASNEQITQNARYQTWYNIYTIFRNISMDPNLTIDKIEAYLMPIKTIDVNVLRAL